MWTKEDQSFNILIDKKACKCTECKCKKSQEEAAAPAGEVKLETTVIDGQLLNGNARLVIKEDDGESKYDIYNQISHRGYMFPLGAPVGYTPVEPNTEFDTLTIRATARLLLRKVKKTLVAIFSNIQKPL